MTIYSKRIRAVQYAQHQQDELIRCAADPYYFITTYAKLQSHALKPRAFQEQAVATFHGNQFVVAKAPRQAGMTTFLVGYALWRALFSSYKTIFFGTIKHDQAKVAAEQLRNAYDQLPDWLKPGCKRFDRLSIEFDNGSCVKFGATTESCCRGMSLSLAIFDGLAYCHLAVQEYVRDVILPCIGQSGQLIVSSTPNGRTGPFAELWGQTEAGLTPFTYVSIGYWDLPIASDHHWQQMLYLLGDAKARQEYNAEFV
mgnify:CR=1 FL=1